MCVVGAGYSWYVRALGERGGRGEDGAVGGEAKSARGRHSGQWGYRLHTWSGQVTPFVRHTCFPTMQRSALALVLRARSAVGVAVVGTPHAVGEARVRVRSAALIVKACRGAHSGGQLCCLLPWLRAVSSALLQPHLPALVRALSPRFRVWLHAFGARVWVFG